MRVGKRSRAGNERGDDPGAAGARRLHVGIIVSVVVLDGLAGSLRAVAVTQVAGTDSDMMSLKGIGPQVGDETHRGIEEGPSDLRSWQVGEISDQPTEAFLQLEATGQPQPLSVLGAAPRARDSPSPSP